jgi:hypothetical protein
MVQGDVEFANITSLRRVWYATSTFPSRLHITYYNERELSEFEATQRKLDALLFLVSPEMGVWRQEGDENLPQGDGDR